MKKTLNASVLVLAFVLSPFNWFERPDRPLPAAYVDRLVALEGHRSSMDVSFNCAAYICFAHSTPYCDAGAMYVGACTGQKIVANYWNTSDLDESKLEPGDIAAWHGVHVAAYLGNGRWIDSDSRRGRVATFQLADKANDSWFYGSVRILRWSQP